MPTLRDSMLARASWYRRWKQLLRADAVMAKIVAEHIRPVPGSVVLDVGCGNGDIRPLLGAVDYTGIDANEDYLHEARAQEDESTRFVAGDVSDLPGMGLGPYDLVIAVGLLHHVDDTSAAALLDGVATALRAGGRFVSVDPAFTPDQRTSARVLAALDRGRHVREPDGYQTLIGAALQLDRTVVRHDLLWLPYTHCIVEASRADADLPPTGT